MNEKDFYRALRTLELLAECELAVAAFYRACAGAWPQEAGLWRPIAGEEEQHARNLGRMRDLATGRPADFEPGLGFSPFEVRSLIEGLHRQTQKVRGGKLGREAAHGIAREIERSLVERRYYGVFVTADREYGRLLREIMDQTAGHAAALLAAAPTRPLEAVFAR